jgi:hypothetical protein
MKKYTSLKISAIVAVLVFVGAAAAFSQTSQMVFNNWASGNAGAECLQVGDFTYAFKMNEGGSEGAPNITETADFYDMDGNFVHTNTITILNSDGKVFDYKTDPNGIGAVIVKAGTGANVFYNNPQVKSGTGLYGFDNKDVSHATFCWNLDLPPAGGTQWCSPGYWRQEHHLDSWTATGYDPYDSFKNAIGYAPTLSKLGQKVGATADPTLFQVLSAPQYYGGDAFNAVGDLLSKAHPDVDFLDERVEDSCPLN